MGIFKKKLRYPNGICQKCSQETVNDTCFSCDVLNSMVTKSRVTEITCSICGQYSNPCPVCQAPKIDNAEEGEHGKLCPTCLKPTWESENYFCGNCKS